MTWFRRACPHFLVTPDRNWPCPCAATFDHSIAPRSFSTPQPTERDPSMDWPHDRYNRATSQGASA